MKRRIISMIVFFVFISITISAQPKIQYSEKTYDFGNIHEGDVVTHNYVVWNAGTEDLKLERVRASCGCTAAQPDKDVLAPGDSTIIGVSFNSHGRTGVQRKYVYVFSNDPRNKQIRLAFTTNVLKENELDAKKVDPPKIALNKKEVDFGDLPSGDVKSTDLNVINKGKTELVINDVKSSCECIVASLSKKRLAPGEVTFLHITFNSEGRSGELTRTVTLHSNDPGNTKETIIIYANVLKGEGS